jgi:NAD(P)H-hydrate epimerase
MVRLTRAQVREIDRRAIEDYHIPGVVLMENAARAVVDVVMKRLPHAQFKQVLILCGGGNNGGDGLAVARHLHNRGVRVSIALTTDPSRYSGDALTNWRIVQAMKLPIIDATVDAIHCRACSIVVDAIFGTGLTEAPRHPFELICLGLSMRELEVIAVDLPSGLDCDTGKPLGSACIEAKYTVTFVAEKAGFANPESKQYTGDVYVGDIGCPRELIEQVASMKL